MCGIFGFVSLDGRGPSIPRLQKIAAITERRGRHAFGLAWIEDGKIEEYKRPGAATDDLTDLEFCRGSQVVIGHCRYATHGCPEDNRNNHPHHAGRGVYVHNGVVLNHERMRDRYNLEPSSECDSEVLGLVMGRVAGSIGRRALVTARMAQGNLAMLGIWTNPLRLLFVRHGNPMHWSQTERGFYFASLAPELPGTVRQVPDGYVGVLEKNGLGLELDYHDWIDR